MSSKENKKSKPKGNSKHHPREEQPARDQDPRNMAFCQDPSAAQDPRNMAFHQDPSAAQDPRNMAFRPESCSCPEGPGCPKVGCMNTSGKVMKGSRTVLKLIVSWGLEGASEEDLACVTKCSNRKGDAAQQAKAKQIILEGIRTTDMDNGDKEVFDWMNGSGLTGTFHFQ